MINRRKFVKQGALWLASSALIAEWGFPSIVGTRRRRQKPPGPLCINWGHPLSRGLSVLFLFDQTLLRDSRDLVQQSRALGTPSGTYAYVSGIEGPGIQFGGTNSRQQLGETFTELDLRFPSKNCTILLIRRKTDATFRNAISFGALYARDNGQGYAIQAAIPWGDGSTFFDWGGYTSPNRVSVAGLSYGTNVDYFGFRAGDSGSAIYRNGFRVANQATAIVRSVPSVDANSEFFLNGLPLSTGGDFQEIFFFAVYNVEWTDAEFSWWAAEPYAMLQPLPAMTRYFLGFGGSSRRTVIMQ